MTTKTKQATEFDLLDPETIEAVPDLTVDGGPGQPLLDLVRTVNRLRDQKKRVLEELNHTSESGAFGPQIKFDASADAEALLAGAPLSDLTAPVAESQRAALMRQLRALERAIPSAEGQVGGLEATIILEQCEAVRPIAQQIVQDTIDACRHLLACLQTERQFHDLLNRRGLRHDRRPGYLQEWPQMIGWLNGDMHRPSLQYFINERSKAAGLDDENGPTKKEG